MANIYLDGFDLYNAASDMALNGWTGGFNFSTTAGRFGGGTPDMQGAVPQLAMTNTADFWVGFAYEIVGGANQAKMFRLYSAFGVEATLEYNYTTGVWTAYRGDGGTSLQWIKGEIRESDYPRAAFDGRISGTVHMRFTVGVNGTYTFTIRTPLIVAAKTRF